jgi:hypothetical protein
MKNTSADAKRERRLKKPSMTLAWTGIVVAACF